MRCFLVLQIVAVLLVASSTGVAAADTALESVVSGNTDTDSNQQEVGEVEVEAKKREEVQDNEDKQVGELGVQDRAGEVQVQEAEEVQAGQPLLRGAFVAATPAEAEEAGEEEEAMFQESESMESMAVVEGEDLEEAALLESELVAVAAGDASEEEPTVEGVAEQLEGEVQAFRSCRCGSDRKQLRRQTEAKYWKVKWGRHYDHAAYLELLRAFATDIWGGGGQATARWIWNQVRLNARKFKLSKRDIRWMAKHLGGIMRIPTKGLYVKLAFLTYKNQACTNKWCCWGRFGLKCGFSCRRCGMHVISQTPNTHHLYLAIGRIAR